MNEPEGTVFVVDDDPAMRRALTRMCQSVGLCAKPFASAREFLDYGPPESPGCLVLDVRLPDLNGLDLQAEMLARNIHTPIVFITGHGDIPMSVRAMKAGAVDFLTKPFRDKNLIAIIRAALHKDLQLRTAQSERESIQSRLQRLTARERQVFDLVIQGLLNKQVADALGASEGTIKVHRRRVMEKMQVASAAELVQLAVKVNGLPGVSPPPILPTQVDLPAAMTGPPASPHTTKVQ